MESTLFFFFLHICIYVTGIHQTETRIINLLVETDENVVASVNLQDSRPISIEVFVMVLAWTNF